MTLQLIDIGEIIHVKSLDAIKWYHISEKAQSIEPQRIRCEVKHVRILWACRIENYHTISTNLWLKKIHMKILDC